MIGEREILLDCEALSALLDDRKEGHAEAKRVLELLVSEWSGAPYLFLVPTIVLYESRRGLLKVNARRRLIELERFLRTYAFLSDFGADAATVSAELWAERPGKPAGERDLMILGCAVVENADVVTRDKGFPTARGVSTWTWTALAARLEQADEE